MTWAAWRETLRGHTLPVAVVDLDALDANAHHFAGLTSDKQVRIASKSIRVPALLQHILDLGAPFGGLMTFTAAETCFLHEQGFDDLWLAYPVASPSDAQRLAYLAHQGADLTVVVDSPFHLKLLERAAAELGTKLGIAFDLDLSLRPLGGRAHLGVRRSPLRSAQEALALADRLHDAPHLELRAVQGYEAQIAGLADHHPHSRALDPIRRWVKRSSKPKALQLRSEVVSALVERGHPIRRVNGGGTGSAAFTLADPSITEITVGSGFFCPTLFDHYDSLDLTPAAFFAIEVVRRSDTNHFTALGGGYAASGAAGPDRLPQVFLPQGCEPLDAEGFGEVQTPFRWRGHGPPPSLGDPILCRHAKAGELMERFGDVLLVRKGSVVDTVQSYRGHGKSFL